MAIQSTFFLLAFVLLVTIMVRDGSSAQGVDDIGSDPLLHHHIFHRHPRDPNSEPTGKAGTRARNPVLDGCLSLCTSHCKIVTPITRHCVQTCAVRCVKCKCTPIGGGLKKGKCSKCSPIGGGLKKGKCKCTPVEGGLNKGKCKCAPIGGGPKKGSND